MTETTSEGKKGEPRQSMYSLDPGWKNLYKVAAYLLAACGAIGFALFLTGAKVAQYASGATTVTGSHCTNGRSRMTETMSSADALFGSLPERCCLATASRLIPSRVAGMVSLPNDPGRADRLPNWFSRTVSQTGPRGRPGPGGRHIPGAVPCPSMLFPPYYEIPSIRRRPAPLSLNRV